MNFLVIKIIVPAAHRNTPGNNRKTKQIPSNIKKGKRRKSNLGGAAEALFFEQTKEAIPVINRLSSVRISGSLIAIIGPASWFAWSTGSTGTWSTTVITTWVGITIRSSVAVVVSSSSTTSWAVLTGWWSASVSVIRTSCVAVATRSIIITVSGAVVSVTSVGRVTIVVAGRGIAVILIARSSTVGATTSIVV